MFRIELGKTYTWFHLRCGGLEVWRHHFARTAPGRPEVNDKRYVVATQVLVKGLIRQFHRLPGEQGVLAFSAPGILVQFVIGNPIDRLAVRANKMLEA